MWWFGGGFNGVGRDARGAVLKGRVVHWVRMLVRNQIQELNRRGPLVHVGREGTPRAIGDERGHGPHAALWVRVVTERGGRGGRASKSCGAPEQIPFQVWGEQKELNSTRLVLEARSHPHGSQTASAAAVWR